MIRTAWDEGQDSLRVSSTRITPRDGGSAHATGPEVRSRAGLAMQVLRRPGSWWRPLDLGGRGQDWKAEPVDPKGHSGDVVAVASVGPMLATASLDGVAKVWDLVEGKLVHRADLIGHEGKVLAVAISPDGGLVATGGADRTVRLWNPGNRTPLLATLKGHSGAVEALAFAPDGKTLASGGLDTSIRLWDVAGRRIVRTLQGHEQGVRGLAFSPDGKTLASASRDHSVKLWDVAKGTEQTTLGRHDAPAWCVAFAPDGKSVASGGLDKTVRLWRVGPAGSQPGQPQPSLPPPPQAPQLGQPVPAGPATPRRPATTA